METSWKELGAKIIKGGAPLLGGLLGGPGGAAAGALVASLFFANPDDPQDIALKMAADPEAFVKLKQFEMKNETELVQMHLADVQSARDREVEITKATGKMNWPMYALAGLVVAGFFGLVLGLMYHTVPEGSREVTYMLFGVLGTSFATIVNYFFGSSKSSADKNIMLQK